MSFFGQNIKKIRSVKGLSQQAFADLFSLKRGTLGAYEEGRSEPKIDTLVKVAKYFSISVDSLLTDELTVNELLQFKGDLTTAADDLARETFVTVPCITERNIKDYVVNYHAESFVRQMPSLQLPLVSDKKFRAYAITGLEMTQHDRGLCPDDIVVGEAFPLEEIRSIPDGSIVLTLVKDEIVMRRSYFVKDKLVLRADHKSIGDTLCALEDVKELWLVKYVFFKRIPEYTDVMEERMLQLEQEFQKLRERFGG